MDSINSKKSTVLIKLIIQIMHQIRLKIIFLIKKLYIYI